MKKKSNSIFFKIHILLLASLMVFACDAQTIYEPLFKCSRTMTNPYGVVTHIVRKTERYDYDVRDKDLQMVKDIKINFVRSDFDWQTFKTKRASFLDYHVSDSAMYSVQNQGLDMLGIIGMDYRLDVSNDWREYVTSTCKRYHNDVGYWEILNEADLMAKFRNGFNSNRYVSFLKNGYKAVKDGNKNAKVLISGFAYAERIFIDSVLEQHVSDYFDIMAVHHYTDKTREPEEFLSFLKMLSAKLTKYQIKKPLWLTETGCFNTIGKENDTIAGNRLPRIFLISFACGVEKVFWYKSRAREINPNDGEDFYGLWHKDFEAKPAYYTYKTLTKMCPNKSTRPKLVRYGDVYISSWKRPARKKVWALWTSKKDELLALNIKGEYKAYDDYGNKILISSGNIEVTPSVIYVVGAKSLNIQE